MSNLQIILLLEIRKIILNFNIESLRMEDKVSHEFSFLEFNNEILA